MNTTTSIILIFSGLGIINTLYLISHVISKKPVKCLFFPEDWCHKVQFSKYSKTFGIPNPITGFLMYFAILILTLLYLYASFPFWPVTALISIGFAFSAYFTLLQALVLKAFCTWCVLSAVDFVILFIAMIMHYIA